MRIEKLKIQDITFLTAYQKDKTLTQCDVPTIAVLYQDSKSGRHIASYQISLDNKELVDASFSQNNVDPNANLLISVPSGGIIIVGRDTMAYHNGAKHSAVHTEEPAEITAFAKVDDTRWLLGDRNGLLQIMGINVEKFTIHIQKVGHTSVASSLAYLDQAYVYVGSAGGDSQLVRMGQSLEVVSTFPNIGPIVDMDVIDLDRQGQCQLITCSGIDKDGSVRVVRNGIALEEQANLELPGIRGMWSLRPTFDAKYERFIVLSFVGETRVMEVVDSSLTEVENPFFDTENTTLLCDTLVGNLYVQITPQMIRLVEIKTLKVIDEWKPKHGKIHNASTSPSQILISLGGGSLLSFAVEKNKLVLVTEGKVEYEISALDIHPLGNSTKSQLAVIGLWTDFSLRILNLSNLKEVKKIALQTDSLPRSLLMSTIDNVDYLLCGMGDGNLFTFKISNGDVKDMKKYHLGTKQISLVPFVAKGLTHVFVCCDRPNVIYSTHQKLVFSNVNMKEINYMCSFNDESSETIAFARGDSLVIGNIDEIQKLHIRTIPLKAQPRRIAYQQQSGTFLVVLDDHALLFNETTLEKLDEYRFDHLERGCSVKSVVLEDKKPLFVIGTGYQLPTEKEASRGRLIVLSVVDDKIKKVAIKEVKGAVMCLAVLNNQLVSSVNSTILLWKWEEVKGSHELIQRCSYVGYLLTITLHTRGDYVVFGDVMKSLSVLLYKQREGVFELVAEDYNPNWIFSSQIMDDENYLCSDDNTNFVVLKKNTDSIQDEERKKLLWVSKYHLGDHVNSIRFGSLVMKNISTEYTNIKSVLYATVNGSIGVIAQLDKKTFDFFADIERAVNQVIKGIGGFTHDEFRSYKQERVKEKSQNFIDGDLVESLMELPKDKIQEVIGKLKEKTTSEEVIRRIEEISLALH